MNNILLALGFLVGGFGIVYYSKWIVDNTGIKFHFLDQYVGTGREYTLWKIIGILLMIAGFYVLFNGAPI